MWGCMCSTGPLNFRWWGYIYNSSYYHHQIGNINISLFVIFFRGCVPGIVRHHMLLVWDISWAAGFRFFYYCAILWCAQIIEYIKARWLYSFVCAYQVHSIYCTSCNIWSCVYSDYPFRLWWVWEYVYFILLSSPNRKYDPFAIV